MASSALWAKLSAANSYSRQLFGTPLRCFPASLTPTTPLCWIRQGTATGAPQRARSLPSLPSPALSLSTSPATNWTGVQHQPKQNTASQQPLARPAPPHVPEVQEPELAPALEQLLGPLSSAPLLPAPKPVVIIISGPSGVGKDAVVQKLKETRSDLYFVVTATSRPMRPMEVEGRDYFFVDRPKFESWIQDDMLLEHANVYGDYKGIPRQQVDDALKAGTDVVLRIDVQGAATVKRLMPEAITIFVTAESERSLVSRLVARKTEDIDKLAIRIKTARNEIQRAVEFDYVVENGTGMLEKCVAQLSSIIDAEKARTTRRMEPITAPSADSLTT